MEWMQLVSSKTIDLGLTRVHQCVTKLLHKFESSIVYVHTVVYDLIAFFFLHPYCLICY